MEVFSRTADRLRVDREAGEQQFLVDLATPLLERGQPGESRNPDDGAHRRGHRDHHDTPERPTDGSGRIGRNLDDTGGLVGSHGTTIAGAPWPDLTSCRYRTGSSPPPSGTVCYNACMRRDSAEARRWTDLATANGIEGVTGRLIEAYSHAGLLPPEGVSDEHRVAHLRQLRSVYGAHPGGADRAARILLPRGFPCAGVREAIARAHGATSLAELAEKARAELSRPLPDPETDEGEAAVESEAQRIISAPGSNALPAVDRRVFTAFLARALANVGDAPLVDSATRTPETPNATLLSGLAQAIAVAYGGSPWAPEALARMGTSQPIDGAAWKGDGAAILTEGQDVVKDAYGVSEEVRMHLGVPFETLVAGAHLVRFVFGLLIEQAPGRTLVGSEDLDYEAGVMAPLGVALLRAAPFLGAIVNTLAGGASQS